MVEKVIKNDKKTSPKKNLFELDEVSVALTDRQKLFCMEYINCKFNGSQAARKAGYEPTNAKEQASHLLTNPNIAQYISELKKDLSIRVGITAEMIALEMAQIGFSNIKNLVDKQGCLKEVNKMSKKASASIASLEVFEEFTGTGENRVYIGRTKKVKLWDKQKALADLSFMLGYNKPVKVAQTKSDGQDLTQDDLPSLSTEEIIKLIEARSK